MSHLWTVGAKWTSAPYLYECTPPTMWVVVSESDKRFSNMPHMRTSIKTLKTITADVWTPMTVQYLIRTYRTHQWDCDDLYEVSGTFAWDASSSFGFLATAGMPSVLCHSGCLTPNSVTVVLQLPPSCASIRIPVNSLSSGSPSSPANEWFNLYCS